MSFKLAFFVLGSGEAEAYPAKERQKWGSVIPHYDKVYLSLPHYFVHFCCAVLRASYFFFFFLQSILFCQFGF